MKIRNSKTHNAVYIKGKEEALSEEIDLVWDVH